jgi:PEP-CTERM motif
MKFGRLIVLGAMLIASVPAALATPILAGEVDVQGGKLLVSATGAQFGAMVSSSGAKTLSGGPNGTVIDGNSTLDFSEFDGGAAPFKYLNATATTPTSLTFAAIDTSGASNGAGTLLYTVVEDGVTLKLFLTDVSPNSIAASSGSGSTAATGAFAGDGYVVVSGNSDPSLDTSDTPVTYSVLNTTGQRGTNFTVSFVADPPAVTPEPSSLVLLGTGMASLAGLARRRFLRA